jgi:hypothetical protein
LKTSGDIWLLLVGLTKRRGSITLPGIRRGGPDGLARLLRGDGAGEAHLLAGHDLMISLVGVQPRDRFGDVKAFRAAG